MIWFVVWNCMHIYIYRLKTCCILFAICIRLYYMVYKNIMQYIILKDFYTKFTAQCAHPPLPPGRHTDHQMRVKLIPPSSLHHFKVLEALCLA